VPHDRVWDEPPFPADLRRPVGEVDVLDVVAIPAVPAADLHQHRAAHEQAGAAEQPVALGRLVRARAVVGDLVLIGLPQETQRRPPPERAERVREAAERRLPRAVGPEDERADEARARMSIREAHERSDCVLLRDRIRVRDDDVLPARGRDACVHVRREGARGRAVEHAYTLRHLAHAAGDIRDHDELVDLRSERRQRLGELAHVPVRDDDRRHLHASASR
jgi:hypothetical protein